MPLFSSIPFWHSETNEDGASRAFPWYFSFGGSNATVQSFQQSLADVGLNTVQQLYIDAADSPGPTTIVIAGTRQRIQISGNSQGYLRILGSPVMLDYSIVNLGNQGGTPFTIALHWLNIVACDNQVWSTA